MLELISQKFRGGCMMVTREDSDTVAFLGTAFLVHAHGYLLTAAHIVHGRQRVMLVHTETGEEFSPMTFERVTALPARVVSRDTDHDVALLKIDREMEVGVPDDFLGTSEAAVPGSHVVCLGYSFGHQQLHALLTLDGVLCAKIRSPNDTRLMLFNTMVHDGDRGGPLINAGDGRIVGIVSGRFEPGEVVRGSKEWDRSPPPDTNVSLAVAIEYGMTLMAAEGLTGA